MSFTRLVIQYDLVMRELRGDTLPLYSVAGVPDGLIKRWSSPLALYAYAFQQLPHMSNPQVRANLSWEADRYWLNRRSDNSLKTLQGLAAILKVVSTRYPDINKKGEVILGKPQPSLIESIGETIKRLRFLQKYVTELPDPIISCISGGSMSYGRFFNVRGGKDPSDLDLILVFEPNRIGELHAEDIAPVELGFKEEDVKVFEERLRIFQELLSKGKAQVMSQKTDLPQRGFSVSMHIMGRDTFNQSMVHGPTKDVQIGQDTDTRVVDYKPEPFKHQVMMQRDFHGEPHGFMADETPLKGGLTSEEVTSRLPSNAIIKGNYVPGIYQNLVSPRFEFEPLTSNKISAAVTMYWAFMMDLASLARAADPNASILKSHSRYPLFSPGLIQYYASQTNS